jgi:arylsulfatase A-like enzyme
MEPAPALKDLRRDVGKLSNAPEFAVRWLARRPRALYGWKKRFASKPLFEESWDNLIILDGCQYTAIRKNAIFDGELEHRWSPATVTREFMNWHFSTADHAHDDTILVTAAKFDPLNPDSFFRFVDNDDEFNPELGTIPPEPVIEKAAELSERYDDKRIILWLLQPHSPFIDKDGVILDGCGGWNSSPSGFDGRYDGSEPKVWELLESGEVEKEQAWDAYVDSLVYVQEQLKPFLEQLRGKTVITSDHGQVFGSRPSVLFTREYGGGTPGPKMMKVPWLNLPYDETKAQPR